MKYGLKISALGSVILGALAASQVQAHGWVEFPSARQNTCYLDGGFGITRFQIRLVRRPMMFLARFRLCSAMKYRPMCRSIGIWPQ